MINSAAESAIDYSILEILSQYDKAWLPPRIAKICEPMKIMGLIERDGEQWRLTKAGRAMISIHSVTRH